MATANELPVSAPAQPHSAEKETQTEVEPMKTVDLSSYGESYCVKCRKKTQAKNLMYDSVHWESKTGKKGERNAVSGDCGTCGKKIRRFVKKPKS